MKDPFFSEYTSVDLANEIDRLARIAEREFDLVAGYPENVDFDMSDVAMLAGVRDEIIHSVSQAINRKLEERLVLYKARYENLLPKKVMNSIAGGSGKNLRQRSLENIREHAFQLLPCIIILNGLQIIKSFRRNTCDNK